MDDEYIELEGRPRRRDDLLTRLRRYSANCVKIRVDEQDRCKGLVKAILTDRVLKLCKSSSKPPICCFEYTGSLYEGLPTKGFDVDVMMILNGRPNVVTEWAEPGYVRLRVKDESSPLRRYADSNGYLDPERFRSSWCFSLVKRVVNEIERTEPFLHVKLVVRSHGPAVQLDIIETSSGKLLSCDLVPSFRFGDDYYVAKSADRHERRLLWRQSFSLKEKQILANMDRDGGCRHELLRIVKMILRSEPTFTKLSTYHMKTAFLWYMESVHRSSTVERPWDGHRLAERFKGFLGQLVDFLRTKTLPNYWVSEMDLFEDIDDRTLDNMAYRLRRLLNDARGCLTNILDAAVPEARLPNPYERPRFARCPGPLVYASRGYSTSSSEEDDEDVFRQTTLKNNATGHCDRRETVEDNGAGGWGCHIL